MMNKFLSATLIAWASFSASAQVLSLICDVTTNESYQSGTRTTQKDSVLITIETVGNAVFIEGIGGNIQFSASNKQGKNVVRLMDKSTTTRWEFDFDVKLSGFPKNSQYLMIDRTSGKIVHRSIMGEASLISNTVGECQRANDVRKF